MRKNDRRREKFLWDFYALARLVLFVVALMLLGFTGWHWASVFPLIAAVLCLPGIWTKWIYDRLRIREWIPLTLSLVLLLTGGVIRTPTADYLREFFPPAPVAEETGTPAGETGTPAGESPAADLLASLPAYKGEPYAVVNGNVPFFEPSEITADSYERYGELDRLGRCTACAASVGKDLMPSSPRESIYEVKPTGWHSIRYDFIDGESLYNRCHLIGFQLTGENANARNLITGTRYLNTEGMLPFENEIASYVRSTGRHVLYRVTPLFQDQDLVARGVLMEAVSVEDNGAGVRFCVFCYNVQPGVYIDYATGDASLTWEDAA